ncbi:hypothetical protein GCM10010193_23400 [Kitasatospora atroaurantiaca]|nr:helix-turn-helix domain-containing protein [Kitasatospora atroaurantiaca]
MTRDLPAAGTELGRYLRARRALVSPSEAGLEAGTGLRRTPGLRREELATLAGISIDHYTRLERGRETRPSASVVDALARALLLEEDEHEHLRSLAARAARSAAEPHPVPSRTVRPDVKLLLETVRPNPSYVLSRTTDILAANPGGLRLLAGIDEWPAKHRNIARCRKRFRHPEVGELTLCFQSLNLEGTPGHRLTTYFAAPGTPEHDALVLLDMAAGERDALDDRAPTTERTAANPTARTEEPRR